MTTPSVPPYFGSWEELVRLMINNPFLGSGSQAPHPLLAYFQQQRLPHSGPPYPGPVDIANFMRSGIASELNPQPLPPRAITSLLVSQIAVRDLTSKLKEQGSEMTARLDQAISDEIDFVCGNVPHQPIPGPSPFALAVAGELNLIGNVMQEGTLRTAIVQMANQITNRATAPVAARKETRIAA